MNETDDPERLLSNARDMAQYYKTQRDTWRSECLALRAVNARPALLVRRADELAAAASALPDVVKTKALQAALSKYRRARG